MDPLSLGVLGLGTIKLGFGLFQNSRQAEQQRAATREMVRRMQLQNAQVLGGARAIGAADEFGLSGSLPAYIQLLGQEMAREVDWARRTGMRATSFGEQAGIFGAATDFGGTLLKFGAMNGWYSMGRDAAMGGAVGGAVGGGIGGGGPPHH